MIVLGFLHHIPRVGHASATGRLRVSYLFKISNFIKYLSTCIYYINIKFT